ncbi:hypothetical protein [Alicyclobacillus vulcanalis]|nr:hypothetical protein [Alicyclobacillus vulcanalis]
MKNKTKWLGASAACMIALGGTSSVAMAGTTSNMWPVKPTPATSNAAINLRVSLDNLLGQHAVLAIEAMEAGYDNAPDYSAWVNVLNQNTDALSNAIASVYGASAGAQFKSLWQSHIQDFVNYVVATVKDDPNGQQAALNALQAYEKSFAQFLASANPYLNEATVQAGLQEHVQELLTAFTDYVNKDYTDMAQELVKAYNHMFMVGDALAGAIVKQFPQKFGMASPNTPAANLVVALDQLLALHADLANLAMEAGYSGAGDFQALAGVLNQNTTDLSNTYASVYGQQAGSEFEKFWAGHIQDFVNYVVATAKNDSSGQQAALQALEQYKVGFSEFLNSEDPYVNVQQQENGLETHIEELLATFNDYVKQDYTDSANEFVMSYNHMFMAGAGLATSIVDQYPTKFVSSSDTWTWTGISLEVNGQAWKMPLGVWGINSATNQSEQYVPIWYVMQVLDKLNIHNSWNGHEWMIQTSGSYNWNSKFSGGYISLDINGHVVGMANGTVLVDPYSHKPTTFMAMSDVAKILNDLGLKYTWGGSTLNIMTSM